jgi:hypothetical protein
MYPLVKTPLIADDFGIALGQSFRVNQSWPDQWDLAWSSIFSGTHFNLIGNFIAMLWIKLWISLSVTFDLNLHLGFWVLKVLVMAGTALSIAWFASKHFLLPIRYSIIASTLLFSTLIQIHAPWSNDPVTNFTLAGFFVVPFALFAISSYIVFLEKQTLRWLVISFSTGLLATLIYEINFAIVGFQVVFLFTFLIAAKFKGSSLQRKSLIFLSAPSGLLIFCVYVLRSFAADDAENYGGTSISISLRTLTTFAYNMISSLPFSAFFKSIGYVNGSAFSKLNLILVVTFIALMSYLLSQTFIRRAVILEKLEKANPVSNTVISVGLLFWIFSGVGIQSITSKIQMETHSIGSVYTFYAVSYVGLTLILLANLRFFFRKEILLIFSAFMLVGLTALQLQINLGLKVWLNQNLQPNMNLVALATGESTPVERCAALEVWLAGSWPEYYESETVVGLNMYSMLENNEEFCPKD